MNRICLKIVSCTKVAKENNILQGVASFRYQVSDAKGADQGFLI